MLSDYLIINYLAIDLGKLYIRLPIIGPGNPTIGLSIIGLRNKVSMPSPLRGENVTSSPAHASASGMYIKQWTDWIAFAPLPYPLTI